MFSPCSPGIVNITLDVCKKPVKNFGGASQAPILFLGIFVSLVVRTATLRASFSVRALYKTSEQGKCAYRSQKLKAPPLSALCGFCDLATCHFLLF